MEFLKASTPQSGLGVNWSGVEQPGHLVAPSCPQDASVAPLPNCGSSMGPVLSGRVGGALSPSECGERGASCPAYPAIPASPAKLPVSSVIQSQQSLQQILPAKASSQPQISDQTSPSGPALFIGSSSVAPPRPAHTSKESQSTINPSSNEHLNEDDILITGNRNLILNSVLTFTYQMSGKLNKKELIEQLCIFYTKEKLLKAYKLAYSLVPKSRKLRSKPDPNSWKSSLISHHIVNMICEFKNEELYLFASLHLDVPLCHPRELTKSSNNSQNSGWNIFGAKKPKLQDQGTQYKHQIYNNDSVIDQSVINAVKYINDSISNKSHVSVDNVSSMLAGKRSEFVNNNTDVANNTTQHIPTKEISTDSHITGIINPLCTEENLSKNMVGNIKKVEPMATANIPSLTTTPNPPNISTPKSIAAPPLLIPSPELIQPPDFNQELLDAVCGIHKTLLRRLPKPKNNRQMAIAKKKQNLRKSNNTRNFSSIMKDIMTFCPEDFEASKSIKKQQNPNTPASESQFLPLTKASTLTYSRPLATTTPVTCTGSVASTGPIISTGTSSACFNLPPFQNAHGKTDSNFCLLNAASQKVVTTPLVASTGPMISTGTSSALFNLPPFQNVHGKTDYNSWLLNGAAQKVVTTPSVASTGPMISTGTCSELSNLPPYQNVHGKIDYSSCVPTSYPTPVIPPLPVSLNAAAKKTVPPPPGFPPLGTKTYPNHFFTTLFSLDEPSTENPHLAVTSSNPSSVASSVAPLLPFSHSLAPSSKIPPEVSPLPSSTPSSISGPQNVCSKPAETDSLSSQFSPVLIDTSSGVEIPDQVNNWLKTNNMLLLKNHTQPEAILDLIGNKNKNVKVATKQSKDTESFNSHAHNLDQEVKEKSNTKGNVKPLSGSTFPDHHSKGSSSRPSSRPSSPSNEPLKFSSRPSSRNTSPNRPYLNPQRHWPTENIRPEGLYNADYRSHYQNQNLNAGTNHNVVSANYPQYNNRRPSYTKRPNHVSETSNRVTTIGVDGSTYQQTSTAVMHDGEEVYRKTSADIRQDRLKELEAKCTKSGLEGSKRPHELRLYLTKCNPATTSAELEYFLLDNFENIEKAIIKKNHMTKSRYYCSFLVLLVSSTPLVFEDFERFDWPDDVLCFPGRDNRDPDYRHF